jgi:hypothetical protein
MQEIHPKVFFGFVFGLFVDIVLLPNFFFFVKDFLWTMDRDRNGLLNGRWTGMDTYSR